MNFVRNLNSGTLCEKTLCKVGAAFGAVALSGYTLHGSFQSLYIHDETQVSAYKPLFLKAQHFLQRLPFCCEFPVMVDIF